MQDTICAISSPAGAGAIALIRVSGNMAWDAVKNCLVRHGKKGEMLPRKSYYCEFYDGENVLDQVLVTFFKYPHSFTGEDMAEISCHGSLYIQKRMLEVLVNQGCRYARAGEFSMRAFMNGKMDLSQAEAVADVIAADSQASLALAMTHLRGGFSTAIKKLREQLLHFTSLLELELDFSEEDVEFANRQSIRQLMSDLHTEIAQLVHSFSLGNAVKNGIPAAIVGSPNAGKSTLLNALLNEERAIVSDIPGTTRDTIEDTIIIDGQVVRFIDTAGIRESQNEIEQLGIERTYQSIHTAMWVLYVIDVSQNEDVNHIPQIDDMLKTIDFEKKKLLIIANKSDLLPHKNTLPIEYKGFDIVYLSAKTKENLELLHHKLKNFLVLSTHNEQVLVSNIRHYEGLKQALDALNQAEIAFDNALPEELIAADIRQVLHHLSAVVGEISNEEILGSIFSRFCIGK
jgi:tRNA modification GTPase